MQLEQSSYFFYRPLILKSPKWLCIGISLLLLGILLFDLIMVANRPPNPSFAECLKTYYNNTHNTTEEYIKQLRSKKIQARDLSDKDIEEFYTFLNSSTLLDVYLDQNMDSGCEIKYEKDNTNNHPIIHMSNSLSLLRLNLQNLPQNFTKEHNIHQHSITIPSHSLDLGNIYLFNDEWMNKFQVLIQSFGNSLVQLAQQKKDERQKEQTDQMTQNLLKSQYYNEEIDGEKGENNGTEDQKKQKEQKEKRQIKNINNKISFVLQDKSINSDLRFFYHISAGKTSFDRLQVQPTFSGIKFQGIFKFIFIFITFIVLYFLSVIVGLFTRLFYIFVMTILSIVGGKCFSRQLGWVHQYIAVVRNASTHNKIKLLCYVIFAIVFTYGLLAFGQLQLSVLFIQIYSPFLQSSYYWKLVFRNLFIIEILFYMFCRTRTSLKFCPYFSMIISMGCVSYSLANPIKLSSFLIHFHLFAHLLLFILFCLVEKLIIEDQFSSDYDPNYKKPRMLFYMGFDLDWHKSIPPIWTYFMKWYDWSYVGERQRVYLEGDYQLLYGRLLGMDEPQELPEQMDEDETELNNLQLAEPQGENME